MTLDYFKDKMFDLLNETDSFEVADIEVREAENLVSVLLKDGSQFEVECRKLN